MDLKKEWTLPVHVCHAKQQQISFSTCFSREQIAKKRLKTSSNHVVLICFNLLFQFLTKISLNCRLTVQPPEELI